MHDAVNMERARTRWRQERHNINEQGPERTTVVVAAAELSHNAAWLGYTLAQLYRHLGQLVSLQPGAARPAGSLSARVVNGLPAEQLLRK
jgi:hypothetical protein